MPLEPPSSVLLQFPPLHRASPPATTSPTSPTSSPTSRTPLTATRRRRPPLPAAPPLHQLGSAAAPPVRLRAFACSTSPVVFRRIHRLPRKLLGSAHLPDIFASSAVDRLTAVKRITVATPLGASQICATPLSSPRPNVISRLPAGQPCRRGRHDDDTGSPPCYRYAEAAFSIADFGAKPDGRTDSSDAFAAAWSAACRSPEPATVYVPKGHFLLRHAAFCGPCFSRITVQINGTLVAPSGHAGRGDTAGGGDEWIVFDHVDGLTVSGGTVDGRGEALWACKAARRGGCPYGATSLTVLNSRDVVISGLKSVDSELYHVVIDGCEGVTLKDVKIVAPGSTPNTDGIHVQASSRVTVTGASIQTGDDCISVGPGTSNLRVEHVSCGPGHGISIGSLGKESEEQGVENVTVTGAAFVGTENGLRIKTWARAAVEGAYVRGVVFQHALMVDVRNPIIIDQNYCPNHGGAGCPHQSSAVKISDVTYSDIQGSSASQVAVKFDCSASNPCSGIGLQDIKLTVYGGKPAEATCRHVDGRAHGYVVPPSCL
ncbi:hypothetical protein ACP4OV_027600 [Aristida adscensionis]